ncbi:GlxA family transcriptional regulator [Paeniglutamicibacter sp. Y32M11]|uniref:GlxA family transcriptional regulator n=1 Tax=Paeniglutamicibacter sp. Y32M11 TaxID=2853258 RepID=UPI00210592EE|nr:DJ-1/PfpI family protein [Paeniglutamicibacter sp. Y32M11]
MRIGLLVFDGMTMLDASGPAEVFNLADPTRQHYEVVYVSPAGGPVVSSSGLELSRTLAAATVGDIDTLLVVGGPSLPDDGLPPKLLEAVKDLTAGARRVASVCTGAFVLAELGYLDGRRATTHWRHARTLAARYPLIKVEEDVIHVRDGRYLTSAGISAGIDLALAMVEDDLGVQTARETARELVMFMQRPGGQTQFSTALSTPPVQNGLLRALMDSVLADPADAHTVASMAAAAGVSVRHLNRMFRAEAGTTPARWIERVRVDAARSLILDGHRMTLVAQLSGFGSDETLRRAFARQLDTTPTSFRDRFTTTRKDSGVTGD